MSDGKAATSRHDLPASLIETSRALYTGHEARPKGQLPRTRLADKGPFAARVLRQPEWRSRAREPQPEMRFELAEILQFPLPCEHRLQQLFGLSPAEAKLARCLARGESLEEVADALAIKITTARTQLAAIFAKTHTRRQAHLVAILSRVAHLDE